MFVRMYCCVFLILASVFLVHCTSPPETQPLDGGEPPTRREPPRREPPKPRAKELPKIWTATLPILNEEKRKTYPYIRSIIHLHSVYSHDACDGKPHIDGKINLPCLLRLRKALCTDHIDVLFITEHRTLMADGDGIDRMMLYLEGDEKLQDGKTIANRIKCSDGHTVTVFPGAENALMPVALQRHPTPKDGQTLKDLYNDSSADAIQRFKDAGAAVIVNHAEGRTLDYLKKHDIHGIEIFNLHAAIDPRIRKSDLKMPQQTALESFFLYLHPDDMKLLPHPDLLFLGFHEPLKVIIDKWDALLADKMVYGYGGSDSHENVLKTLMADGDRGDSYSRMMRWFTNHLQIKEKTLKGYRDALFSGRSSLVFEVLGTPDAFNFYGETSDGTRIDMGATTSATLKHLKVEAKHPYLTAEDKVDADIRLIQITKDGPKEVKRGNNTITLENPTSGTYRVEVWITPKHLKKIVTPKTPNYMKPYPWIYSNPIRIK